MQTIQNAIDGRKVGPLISSAQKGRVQSFVERARAQKHISVTGRREVTGRQGLLLRAHRRRGSAAE
jgi:acyl-CoA reductase-like NAD-dependent aldehyde dehydrogenase